MAQKLQSMDELFKGRHFMLKSAKAASQVSKMR